MHSKSGCPINSSASLLANIAAVICLLMIGCSDDSPQNIGQNAPIDLGEVPRGDAKEHVLLIAHPKPGVELGVSEITSCCGGIEILEKPESIGADEEHWPLKLRLIGGQAPQELKRVMSRAGASKWLTDVRRVSCVARRVEMR